MAYNSKSLERIEFGGAVPGAAPAGGGRSSLWMYVSADSLVTVGAAGYFNSAAPLLGVGDVIVVSGGVGGTSFLADYLVTASDGVGSVTVQAETQPAGILTQFGAGTGTFGEEGNLNRQISSAGVQPGATGADNVLAVYSLPANSFDVSGRGVCITAQGSFGATANNKRIKIIVNPATAVVGSTVGAGGTTIADTGTVATNGGGWSLQGNVFKYGAAASNTQIALHQQAQVGAAVSALLAPSLMTATESGAILVAVTGNATTAASDIVFNFLEINAMN